MLTNIILVCYSLSLLYYTVDCWDLYIRTYESMYVCRNLIVDVVLNHLLGGEKVCSFLVFPSTNDVRIRCESLYHILLLLSEHYTFFLKKQTSYIIIHESCRNN